MSEQANQWIIFHFRDWEVQPSAISRERQHSGKDCSIVIFCVSICIWWQSQENGTLLCKNPEVAAVKIKDEQWQSKPKKKQKKCSAVVWKWETGPANKALRQLLSQVQLIMSFCQCIRSERIVISDKTIIVLTLEPRLINPYVWFNTWGIFFALSLIFSTRRCCALASIKHLCLC